MHPPFALFLIRVLRSTVLLVALVLIAAAAQDRMLYFPDAASVAQTLAATDVASARAWPASDDFRGVLAESSGAAVHGTALVFHGNAGHAGHRGDYIDQLNRWGLRVILVEYPGYGAHAGKLGEASLVADAVEVFALARRQFGGPIYLVGESLGAGVAGAATAALTQRGETVEGLLLITPWDSLANIASHHYPWLPVRWLLNDRYDSVGNLKDYAGPTVVVLASDDRIVPVRFGQALFDGLAGHKQRIVVPGGGHNDWSGRVGDGWWHEVVAELRAQP